MLGAPNTAAVLEGMYGQQPDLLLFTVGETPANTAPQASRRGIPAIIPARKALDGRQGHVRQAQQDPFFWSPCASACFSLDGPLYGQQAVFVWT